MLIQWHDSITTCKQTVSQYSTSTVLYKTCNRPRSVRFVLLARLIFFCWFARLVCWFTAAGSLLALCMTRLEMVCGCIIFR